jgi:hypothetical protein
MNNDLFSLQQQSMTTTTSQLMRHSMQTIDSMNSTSHGHNRVTSGNINTQSTNNTNGNNLISSSSLNVKRRPESNETIFRVNKGVKTFDFSFEKNLLITGG